MDDAKRAVPRCLTRDEREANFLDPEPPAWCVEMSKWPYQTSEWKAWLRYKSTNQTPPLPNMAEWQHWVAAHKTN